MKGLLTPAPLLLIIASKVAKITCPGAIRPHLSQLVQAMLEGLSNFEDTGLNYVEQHAERLGLDQDRLESARVSAAHSSPMVSVSSHSNTKACL